ncbi:helix-turn-helix domain-containing protein [Bradyrhizobium arachidis]|uniref:helix-turn-helix domain-containing protein n=1 Tax=Bradyrhizobium arachidis TaxID=858423 RepID=UPI002161516B|nr:helix-turn-helix domain-containing protein [Bradyrhizobium arachidis]
MSTFDRVVDRMLLSPRELEFLERSAHGKSAWEIGNIFGISPRTVGFHLDNARAIGSNFPEGADCLLESCRCAQP